MKREARSCCAAVAFHALTVTKVHEEFTRKTPEHLAAGKERNL